MFVGFIDACGKKLVIISPMMSSFAKCISMSNVSIKPNISHIQRLFFLKGHFQYSVGNSPLVFFAFAFLL